MTPKKILLLSVSAGAGHMRAAEAIRAFANTHEANINATHLDGMNFVTTGFRKLYTDFLLEQGVALKAFDAVTLEYRIGYLLAHPAKLADMRSKAKALGRPNAARHVLDTVLARLS